MREICFFFLTIPHRNLPSKRSTNGYKILDKLVPLSMLFGLKSLENWT